MQILCGSSVQCRFILPADDNAMLGNITQHFRHSTSLTSSNFTLATKPLMRTGNTLEYLLQQHIQVVSNVYTSVLQSCTKTKAIEKGRQAHAHIVKFGLELTVFMGNVLINMYVKCGCIMEGHKVFGGMPFKNVITWTTMITAYVHQKRTIVALLLFKQMQEDGFTADNITHVIVLSACAHEGARELGQLIHATAMKVGLEMDVNLSSALINLYAKCRSMRCARIVFDSMYSKNVVTWNTLIYGYAEDGDYQEAMKLFSLMQQNGFKPDGITYVCILKACCAHGGHTSLVKCVHAHCLKIEGCISLPVESDLVQVYANCGDIFNAFRVFAIMHVHDFVSWTAMVSCYARNNKVREAILILQQMPENGLKPDQVTYVEVLSACTRAGILEWGKYFHASLMQAGSNWNIHFVNTLIGMYVKCGSLGIAHHLFAATPVRDTVSWNSLIAGSRLHGYGTKIITLSQIQSDGLLPNKVTYLELLHASAIKQDLGWGKHTHAHLVKAGLECDTTIRNTLIDMYAKCGSLNNAYHVFNSMSSCNSVSGTALISGFIEHGDVVEAIKLIEFMREDHVYLNEVAYIIILSTCSLGWGKHIHAQIMTARLTLDIRLENSLVSMYAECGGIENTCQVFDRMAAHDIVSWNILIAGYAEHSDGIEAMEFFLQIQQHDTTSFVNILRVCSNAKLQQWGKYVHSHVLKAGQERHVIVGNSLIGMYISCNNIENAKHAFDMMPSPDMVSWNILISGYAKHGCVLLILKLLLANQHHRWEPDAFTYVNAFTACATIGALEAGKQIHDHMTKSGFMSDVFVDSALIGMYVKCGSILDAINVFKKLPTQDIISWNAMISGYAEHGKQMETLNLLCKMQCHGLKPANVTFLSFLCACNHTGLVDEGPHYFQAMYSVYGLIPAQKHYACLADLLGRAGNLHEAKEVIDAIPTRVDKVLWISFLGACRLHGQVEFAKLAVIQILRLDPENSCRSDCCNNDLVFS